jgi:hypothetical protein
MLRRMFSVFFIKGMLTRLILFSKLLMANIHLTIEHEESFFLLLTRESDGISISTDWFHKKTELGRYLNFKSHLPFSYKSNTVTLF